MSDCIYCRGPLPASVPAEHVIAQSFGTFENNFTLHCVCSDCNGYFGSKLEWVLRGNSVEGALRLQVGLGTGSLGHGGTATFTVSDPGPWKGARIKITANSQTKKAEAFPLPQLGARRNPADDWKWYTAQEITPALALEYPRGGSVQFQIIGASANEQAHIKATMKRNGIDFRPQGKIDPPIDSDGTVGAKLEALFTQQISRCIAKFAFNYLAYCRGDVFVLSSEFDEMRAYIRYGTEPSINLVRPHREPLLLEEKAGGRATDGHIVRVDWSSDNRSIVAQLSLFNTLRYDVVLCGSYHGLWIPDLVQGHHFDLKARRIEALGVTKLHLPW
jgi:hypothetical protein